MKKIYNYILLAVMAFASVGCVDDLTGLNTPIAESGDDVQFGLSLPDVKTRTVYGDQSGNAFPIYWVAGDKVQVFSPQCLEGRRSAEYEVTLPDNVDKANYAKALTKTGNAGVQWGDKESAIFYSLYPSGNYSLSEDGTQAENIVINYSQNIIVDGDDVKSDMEDCLMYAKNDGGEENNHNGVPRGETVNLHYDPISTVVMVTLNVPSSSVDDFTIQSISLTSTNDDIAGTFSLNIADGSFADWGNNKSATVAAQIYDKATGGYYTLAKGNKVEIPLFLAPVKDLNTDGWQIKVIANNKEYLKTLGSQDIVAGQIHKVILPNLSTEKVVEWNVADWMVNIPRNVYLSEVSIPGSWNSINPDFQTTKSTDAETIASQYSQGVRAFHLDTRWKAEYTWLTTFSKVVGLGVADGGDNGSASSSLVTAGDKYMRGSGTPLVEDIIKQLVSYIKETPQEYMVLVCSFAQESVNYEGDNGYWYGEISAICNKSDYANYIVDGSKVNANTLVGDVLGKILVIVNMQDAISSETTLPENSRCVFVNVPSELPSTRFGSLTDAAAVIANNSDELWASTTATTSTGIMMYDSQAQITSSTGSGINHDRGYAPSVNERTSVLNTILDWSKSNYGTDNYAHDAWIYLGLGGYQVSSGGNAGSVSGSYSTIASTYNTWIGNRVSEMGTTPDGASQAVPYYPVGIVLMNYVNDYTSTVKDILTLNNKYRLQYDPSKPTDYVGSNVDTGGDYEGSL